MSEQLGLDLWPRRHDLPPRWDGLPVEWRDWNTPGATFLCPPPRHDRRCDTCRSTAEPRTAVGRIYTDPTTAPRAIGRAHLENGRHLIGVLTACRCPDCGHDTVTDPAGRVWDLDPTDYGDDGSYDVSEAL